MMAEKFIEKLSEEMGSAPRKRVGVVYRRLCEIFPLQRIENDAHHASALHFVTKLSEYVVQGEDDSKEILEYLSALGVLVDEYERTRFREVGKGVSGPEMLGFLMEQHGLKQTDLAEELGGQSVVSEVLSGRRQLNAQQIEKLARRFRVSPAVFFDTY